MLDFYYVLTLGLWCSVPAIDFFSFENFCSILRCLTAAVNPSLPFLIVNQGFRSSYDIFIHLKKEEKKPLLITKLANLYKVQKICREVLKLWI